MKELTRREFRLLCRIDRRKGLCVNKQSARNAGCLHRLETLGYIQIVQDLAFGATPDGLHAMEVYRDHQSGRRTDSLRWRITTIISVAALAKSFLPELHSLAVWLSEMVHQIVSRKP